LVKQKLRKMNAERHQALSEEFDLLLQANFTRETYCPEWLANRILVKKNDKWRVCIDFTSLVLKTASLCQGLIK